MSNMSYCRFQNTVPDLEDCLDALNEADWNLEAMQASAGTEEAIAMEQFVKLIQDCNG